MWNRLQLVAAPTIGGHLRSIIITRRIWLRSAVSVTTGQCHRGVDPGVPAQNGMRAARTEDAEQTSI